MAYRLARYSPILTTNRILHKYVLIKYQLIFLGSLSIEMQKENESTIYSLMIGISLYIMKQGYFKPLHDYFGFSSLNNTFKKVMTASEKF